LDPQPAGHSCHHAGKGLRKRAACSASGADAGAVEEGRSRMHPRLCLERSVFARHRRHLSPARLQKRCVQPSSGRRRVRRMRLRTDAAMASVRATAALVQLGPRLRVGLSSPSRHAELAPAKFTREQRKAESASARGGGGYGRRSACCVCVVLRQPLTPHRAWPGAAEGVEVTAHGRGSFLAPTRTSIEPAGGSSRSRLRCGARLSEA
jgi:hypothetical protein